MTAQIDQLKTEGRFHEAGRLAHEQGAGRAYGCHFGMRSTRDAAIRAFLAGYDEAEATPRIRLEGRIGGWQ
jgi:hypothetical protein